MSVGTYTMLFSSSKGWVASQQPLSIGSVFLVYQTTWVALFFPLVHCSRMFFALTISLIQGHKNLAATYGFGGWQQWRLWANKPPPRYYYQLMSRGIQFVLLIETFWRIFCRWSWCVSAFSPSSRSAWCHELLLWLFSNFYANRLWFLDRKSSAILANGTEEAFNVFSHSLKNISGLMWHNDR